MNIDQLFADGAAAYDAGDFPLALATLLPLARSGHAGAQYIFAMMHRWGNGVEQNPERSLSLLKAAADRGHPKAALDLYFLLDPDCISFPAAMQSLESDILGSRHYMDVALRRIRELAAAGDIKAMADLGFLFHYGYGVGLNGGEAIRWYSAAFNGGEHGAANALCLVYYEGDVSVRDRGKALMWYRKASELDCRCIHIDEFEPPHAAESMPIG